MPLGEEAELLAAAKFMDANECCTLIHAARDISGRTPEEICVELDRASTEFNEAAKKQLGRKGEW